MALFIDIRQSMKPGCGSTDDGGEGAFMRWRCRLFGRRRLDPTPA
jgi:hypothetical protein